ncbi:N-acetylglucosamine-6-phosphate deacetylase [bacterium AH-315-E10]|nr:N-acetylglucosamine-6-phosphate deacetylase [bacterium AH-315-E10]
MNQTQVKNKLIRLDYCLTPTHQINNAAIIIDGENIHAVGGFSAFQHTEQYDVLEMPECYALPGFIDTHLYGAGGFDCMHADSDTNIAGMSKILAQHGVTAFLPTTQSDSREHLVAVVQSLAEMCHSDLPGAMAVGIHVEGPYLSVEKRGAHPKRHIRPIDLDEAEEIIAAGKNMIKIFAFAPELENAVELTQLLSRNSIIPSLGHTMANREQVEKIVNCSGALRCSHLFNGMEPLQQRKVGLAAIALMNDWMWVEIIPDGIHIHPGMLNLSCRTKDKSKIICISNSTEAAGLEDGTYKLGEDIIKVEDGKSMLEDGTIAGSVNFMDQNYRNLKEFTNMSTTEVAACCTMNPARSIGLHDRGEIKPGRKADIVIMDKHHQVCMTIASGRIVYDRETDETYHG